MLDVATYYKQCPQCETCYRYQDWKDGLHNFNDDVILDIPLCLTFRNHLQVTVRLISLYELEY